MGWRETARKDGKKELQNIKYSGSGLSVKRPQRPERDVSSSDCLASGVASFNGHDDAARVAADGADATDAVDAVCGGGDVKHQL